MSCQSRWNTTWGYTLHREKKKNTSSGQHVRPFVTATTQGDTSPVMTQHKQGTNAARLLLPDPVASSCISCSRSLLHGWLFPQAPYRLEPLLHLHLGEPWLLVYYCSSWGWRVDCGKFVCRVSPKKWKQLWRTAHSRTRSKAKWGSIATVRAYVPVGTYDSSAVRTVVPSTSV